MIGKREMQKITITEKLIRNENEAIEAIKANMPTSGYQMLSIWCGQHLKYKSMRSDIGVRKNETD